MTQRSNRREKPIRIGFVPLVDCAPIALAHEAGIFRERGLKVELLREPGWATIRDKMAYGELEAAHALVGLAFALNWGLGVLRQPCLTGYLLNSNGDAITISKSLHNSGITDPESIAQSIKTLQQDRPVTFGVPHLFSTHHFLLLHWLRPAGLQSGRDFQVMVLPPSLMTSCLKAGNIDGFCVGEPFNSIAVKDGDGVIIAQSADISPMHPEKALIVSEHFESKRHSDHLLLIEAVAEAAKRCETPEGREEVAEILSGPGYLGISADLIRSSLFAGSDAGVAGVTNANFHIFSHPDVNRPALDKANWLLTQMRLAHLVTDKDIKSGPSLRKIFREDLFDLSVGALENEASLAVN